MATDLLQQGIQAARLGQKAQAINLLSKAVQESPNSAQAWYNLGTLLEDAQKAGYCLERAFHLDPSLRLDYLSSKSPAPASPPAPAPAPLSAKTPKPVPAEPSTLKPSLSTTLKTAPLRSNFSDNISDLRQSAAPHPFSPVKVEHPESAVVPGAPDLSDLRNSTPARAAAIPFTPVSVQPPAPGAGQAEQTRSDAPDLSDLRNMGGKAASPKKKSKTPERTAPTDGTVPKKRGADQWIKIAIGVMALVVVCVISVGIFLFARGMTPGAEQPAAAAAVTPQQTELATIETPGTPTPSSTPSPSQTPSSTPTLDPTRVYQNMSVQITAAREQIDSGQYDLCLEAYDRLLAKMPNWTKGLHNRAICKRMIGSESHDLSVFTENMQSAILDLDSAIALDPAYAESYVERGFNYENLGNVEENQTTARELLSSALENYQMGLVLKSDPTVFEANFPSTLVGLDRCQEAVDEARRQIAAEPENGLFNKDLQQILASAYVCQGNYQQALKALQRNLDSNPSCDDYMAETKILIGMGKKDKAFEVISTCLENSPSFGGYRYYLRALLHYDRKEPEMALLDLALGSGNTWFHGGLFAYVSGRLAIDQGYPQKGKELLEYAEATFRPDEGLWLKKRIRASLDALNVPYTTPTPAQDLGITPIPPEYMTPGAVLPTPQSTVILMPTRTPEESEPPFDGPTG